MPQGINILFPSISVLPVDLFTAAQTAGSRWSPTRSGRDSEEPELHPPSAQGRFLLRRGAQRRGCSSSPTDGKKLPVPGQIWGVADSLRFIYHCHGSSAHMLKYQRNAALQIPAQPG